MPNGHTVLEKKGSDQIQECKVRDFEFLIAVGNWRGLTRHKLQGNSETFLRQKPDNNPETQGCRKLSI